MMKLLAALLLLFSNDNVAFGSNICGSGSTEEEKRTLGIKESDNKNGCTCICNCNTLNSPSDDGDSAALVENQDGITTPRGNFSTVVLPEVIWTPQDDEVEPMDDDDLQEIMSRIPSDILKGISAKPGKGLGRVNLKALINSGKPFLLNGMDADLRADLEEEMKFKLNEGNQPYVIVVPTKARGDIAYHFFSAVTPIYKQVEGETLPEKQRRFLLDFLDMADKSHRKVLAGIGREDEDESRSNNQATPRRSYVHTQGPFRWCENYTSTGACINKYSEYWETVYVDYYKLTNGHHNIKVKHEGNWNSRYYSDENQIRGWANGHSTLKVIPPPGYSITDYLPKNINQAHEVSETTSFELSGTAECGPSECSGGVGGTVSQSRTLTYSIRDWEILSNGYGQWDFKQLSPFKAYESFITFSGCFWRGCVHDLPALSRGTFNHGAAVILTSSGDAGWKRINFENTGRPWLYGREDAWHFLAIMGTFTAKTHLEVLVG